MKRHELARRLFERGCDDLRAVEAMSGIVPVADWIVGFHGQQAIEKFVKCVLAARGIVYPRTHNLRALMDLAAAHGEVLPEPLAEADRLTPFAVEQRYDPLPEEGRVALDRHQALAWVRAAERWARARLDASSEPQA